MIATEFYVTKMEKIHQISSIEVRWGRHTDIDDAIIRNSNKKGLP